MSAYNSDAEGWFGLFAVVVFITTVAGWLTHIFYCFAHGLWGFLIAGALFFPIGILHGWWIWVH